MEETKTIVLIGAGRVAKHLGKQIKALNWPILCVWSRTDNSAQKLGQSLECPWTSDLADIPEADLYIILIKDDAIESVAKNLSKHTNPNSLIVHTSGAVSSSVLKPFFNHYGVFYPLQTFSEGTTPDFTNIPLCIYANHITDLDVLEQLADQISHKVHTLNDEQRAYLHLSAVFVNNFTNYLQYISKSLLEEQKLPYSLLKPLLDETVKKLDILSPQEAQTGPAARGDEHTINKHLTLLENKPEWQEIYRKLSDGIKTSREEG